MKKCLILALIVFAAMISVAWFAKPKSLNAEIEALGIQLTEAKVISSSAFNINGPSAFFDISEEDKKKLRRYLYDHEFSKPSSLMIGTSGMEWFDRPAKLWPFRHHQSVWIIEGEPSQVQFEPPIR